MRRFGQVPDHELDDLATSDPGSETPPAVPAQQPAAIEPVWSNGRLTLPKAAAKSDLKGRSFGVALKSLREEMRAFADHSSTNLSQVALLSIAIKGGAQSRRGNLQK